MRSSPCRQPGRIADAKTHARRSPPLPAGPRIGDEAAFPKLFQGAVAMTNTSIREQSGRPGAPAQPRPPARAGTSLFVNGHFPRRRGLVLAVSTLIGFLL